MATNIAVLEGHLTKDPELKVTGSGKKVCSFTVANNKPGKDAGANFIDCVAWEGRGETISKYFKKGSQIVVTGRLDQQVWKTQDGQNRSKLVIIVDDFSFIGKKEEKENLPTDEEVDGEFDLSQIPF